MFRDNRDRVQKNIERAKILEGKSAGVSNSVDDFVKHAKQQALAKQPWKDYVRNLKQADLAFEKSQAIPDLEAYETRLAEACSYLKTKYADKNQVYKLKEINDRKALLRTHREKIQLARQQEFEAIQAARMQESDFLDDVPSVNVSVTVTSSPTISSSSTREASPVSINTPSPASREASVGKKSEVTYTSISSITVPEGAPLPEEEESFSASFFKSFTRCCRPNTKLPSEPTYTTMKKSS